VATLCVAGLTERESSAAGALKTRVERAELVFATIGEKESPDHRVVLHITFPRELVPESFDPRTGRLRIKIGGETVLSLPAEDSSATVARVGDRWIWREKESSKRTGTRSLVLGVVSVTFGAKGLDLSALREGDPKKITIRLRIGASIREGAVKFAATKSKWVLAPAGQVLLAPKKDLSKKVAFRVLRGGSDSAIHEAGHAVARTAAEWKALWKRHEGKGDAPAVDFKKEMVVGIFLGKRFMREAIVTGVRAKGKTLTIRYEDRKDPRHYFAKPPPWVYVFIAVAKFDGAVKLEGKVVK
jgi:hypothetical protein